MKRFLIPVFFFLFALSTYSQDKSNAKPDCKPKACSSTAKKSCGPNDTKVGEANVIIELRNDIQEIKNEAGLFGKIGTGITDEESLAILIDEMKQISQATGIEFPQLRESKAGKVADLRELLQKVAEK